MQSTHAHCNGDNERFRSKKQVRFFEDDKLEERFELEISDQERKAKWMTRSDFRAIHLDICHAIQECFVRRTSSQLFDDESYYNSNDDSNNSNNEKCFRGLEALVSSGRKVEIQAFIQDLLEMQEELRDLGHLGPKGLHDFSENHSKPAIERARRVADKDASEARRVYAESFLGVKRQ